MWKMLIHSTHACSNSTEIAEIKSCHPGEARNKIIFSNYSNKKSMFVEVTMKFMYTRTRILYYNCLCTEFMGYESETRKTNVCIGYGVGFVCHFWCTLRFHSIFETRNTATRMLLLRFLTQKTRNIAIVKRGQHETIEKVRAREREFGKKSKRWFLNIVAATEYSTNRRH